MFWGSYCRRHHKKLIVLGCPKGKRLALGLHLEVWDGGTCREATSYPLTSYTVIDGVLYDS